MRTHRTAVFAPRSRYDVIPVSRSARCRLRGRHPLPVTHLGVISL
ncbi:hypothetical protein AB0892_06835 [Streptomyces sp. NPDC005409]